MPTPRQSRLPEPPGPQSTHFRHRFSRRGGYQPPEPHRRDHHGLRSTQPGHGGMRACRPTRFVGGAAGTAGLFGRPYRPPLRRGLDLVRRAGCPHPVKAGCRNHHGLRSTRPGHGGMRACRPTRFGEGSAGIEGVFGRLLAAPTGASAAVPDVRTQKNGRSRRTCRFWCERGDSNSHAIGHTHLKRACLPFQHSRISECLYIISSAREFVNRKFKAAPHNLARVFGQRFCLIRKL